MSEYRFSKKGKIDVTSSSLLLFSIPIIILIYISRFAYLYYITWIPLLWLIYNLFVALLYVWTTVFVVDEKGFIARSALDITKTVLWEDIEDIKTVKHKTNITSLKIFAKSDKRPFVLQDTIENHEKFFETILNNFHKLRHHNTN